MVYCTKCGFKNEEDADFCAKCGTPLDASQAEKSYDSEKKISESEKGDQKNRYLGLPHAGTITGIVFGVVLILMGVVIFFGRNVRRFLGSFLLILFGLLLLIGALYGWKRKRR